MQGDGARGVNARVYGECVSCPRLRVGAAGEREAEASYGSRALVVVEDEVGVRVRGAGVGSEC